MELIRLNGTQARAYVEELGALRLKIFWDFPYLYEGTLEDEKKYLETYLKAKHSFILLVKDGERFVGATTAILASEEEESFRKPFQDQGFEVHNICYYGESILLPEYRGKGIGKVFFQEREAFARKLGVSYVSFCAVEREAAHSMRPAGYKPLHDFWNAQGFKKVQGMETTYTWKDRNEQTPSPKLMQFWMKSL